MNGEARLANMLEALDEAQASTYAADYSDTEEWLEYKRQASAITAALDTPIRWRPVLAALDNKRETP